MPTVDSLRAAVRDVLDFPKPGIVFKDITPILADADLFRFSIDLLCETASDRKIDKVVGIDARRIHFRGGSGRQAGSWIRSGSEKGKLPWKTRQLAYELEYGESVVELHEDAVSPGEAVLVVDDLLATGGTAGAAVRLLEESGAEIVAVSFLIELRFLDGRRKLGNHRIESVLSFD